MLCFVLALSCLWQATCFAEEVSPPKNLKVLHLTFHSGCAKEIEGVAKELSIELTTWFIHTLPPCTFDGVTQGSAIYNIGHDRADRIWNLHRDFFNSFDVILTSDTAPLSRIFLQNGCEKPLIIWVCNRFDYYDGASLDCDFPDKEYYDLFAKATSQENVKIIAYTAYEKQYAQAKGIDIGDLLIKPLGKFANEKSASAIPPRVVKSKSFFLPPYHNETIFMDAHSFYTQIGIENYCGRYGGPADLEEFRAIIHLPYAWSNLALFENVYLGVTYLVPSAGFMKKLIRKENYFFTSDWDLFHLSEWYAPENAPYFVYFDSWEDLAVKSKVIDFPARKENIKKMAREYADEMLGRWKAVFQECRALTK